MPTPPFNILIIEDDITTATLLGAVLEHSGHQTTHMPDGREALRFIDTHPPADLVLLDIIMPYADGHQVLKTIRRHPQWKDVPVIMLSSLTQKGITQQLIAEGANDSMTKPVDTEILMDRIHKVVGE